MIKSRDYVKKHEDSIQKDADAIVEVIAEHIENTGQLIMNYALDFAPVGTASIVALKVKDQLKKDGWLCDFTIHPTTADMTFDIKLDLSTI